MLLGVAKKELGETFAEVLRLLGVERALVVCGKEGLDEISIAGETWVSVLIYDSMMRDGIAGARCDGSVGGVQLHSRIISTLWMIIWAVRGEKVRRRVVL